MPLKVWYGELGRRAFLADLSSKALSEAAKQGRERWWWWGLSLGGGWFISSRRLSRRDMRRPAWVTHKQPWSMGAASREKHCLGVDNKLLPRLVIAPRPMADPPPTAAAPGNPNPLSLKGRTNPSVSDTWLGQVCVLVIWNFMALTFCWILNTSQGELGYSLIEGTDKSPTVSCKCEVHACR